jgi:hypothetical protein
MRQRFAAVLVAIFAVAFVWALSDHSTSTPSPNLPLFGRAAASVSLLGRSEAPKHNQVLLNTTFEGTFEKILLFNHRNLSIVVTNSTIEIQVLAPPPRDVPYFCQHAGLAGLHIVDLADRVLAITALIVHVSILLNPCASRGSTNTTVVSLPGLGRSRDLSLRPRAVCGHSLRVLVCGKCFVLGAS